MDSGTHQRDHQRPVGHATTGRGLRRDLGPHGTVFPLSLAVSFWPARIWDPAALLRLKDFSPEAQNLLRGGGGLGPAHAHSWLGSASEQEPQIWKKPLLTGRGQSLRINGSGRDFLQRWCHGPAWVGTSSQSPVNRGGHLQAGHALWLAMGCPCRLGTLQSPQPQGGHEQGSQALHSEWSEPREPRFFVPLRYKPREACVRAPRSQKTGVGTASLTVWCTAGVG